MPHEPRTSEPPPTSRFGRDAGGAARGRALATAAAIAMATCLAVAPSRAETTGTSTAPSPAAAATSAPAWVTRGDQVEASYEVFRGRVGVFFNALSERLRSEAPDLYQRMQGSPPTPIIQGYQILPKLLPETPFPTTPVRSSVHGYSWPWTGQMIERETQNLAGLESDLARAAGLPPKERRPLLEKLVAAFPALPAAQNLIDAHVRYNRLWQRSIASAREVYDRQTRLKNAVLERDAIRDALEATDDASLREKLKRVPISAIPAEALASRDSLMAALRRREAEVVSQIHAAIDDVSPRDFVSLERPAPNRWIVHVPIITDIVDEQFLEAFRSAVERTWRVSDGDVEYSVVLTIERISPTELYRPTGQPPPQRSEPVDFGKHLALFPPGRAVLTTGGGSGHVTANRCIVIGPHAIPPIALAHEVGHILGFDDVYFRGYTDLGPDGFLVEEVVAEPNDIMSLGGPVRREQFERLVAVLAKR